MSVSEFYWFWCVNRKVARGEMCLPVNLRLPTVRLPVLRHTAQHENNTRSKAAQRQTRYAYRSVPLETSPFSGRI